MNNYGTGAEKVCRFVFTRSFDMLGMTKFFGCARNENLFGAYLLTVCATSKTEHEPQRRRAFECRARRLYENAWLFVTQAATQAKWHNKGTILIYASAACLPRERRILL